MLLYDTSFGSTYFVLNHLDFKKCFWNGFQLFDHVFKSNTEFETSTLSSASFMACNLLFYGRRTLKVFAPSGTYSYLFINNVILNTLHFHS